MYASIIFPETLEPDELDKFLANGWYRMGQSIFTTHFLCFNNCFYSAMWLRVNLTDAIADTTYKRLQKQNKSFITTISKAEITPKHEQLYSTYRKSIAFEPSETLQSLLYGQVANNRFNTHMVTLHDGDKLIATGYFDLGKESAAGIVSFYHPDYKKYSLGKYLIYSKMLYCREQNMNCFYPGYVVPGYPPFDYKTTIGRETLEYFSVSQQQWIPYSSFNEMAEPLKMMYEKLMFLQKMLKEKSINSNLLHYRFFDANLDPYYSGDRLFDYPVFLQYTNQVTANKFTLIVYDVVHATYCLVECESVLQTDWYKNIESIFSAHLLRLRRIQFSSSKAEELVTRLLK